MGSPQAILLPSLDQFRAAPHRLRGLRLLHTHLEAGGLTTDDLTDLALLRLDLVCAIDVLADGIPGRAHAAHLVPENPENRWWDLLPPVAPAELPGDFLGFVQALEGEFARTQRARPVDAPDRAILVRVETRFPADGEEALAELRELARSCGVEVFDAVLQHRPQLDPRFVVGRGKLSALAIRALQIGANLLIFDHELTAAQVRSLSDATELKVLDRTQVILDIFAQRAHSREGKIQVELAQLRYRLPRLTGKGTAMSRLTGGIGARGPGEMKLEIDRRRVRERIHHLEKEIRKVQKARSQRRGRRERTGLPILSIVGYTNAGKSTLLNALTKSQVLTEDRLFATLDPKTARLRFPRDREAAITDTVGFLRDLPPDLFAAFQATLEELHEADALIHVVDVSNPRFEEQMTAVEDLLARLGIAHKPTVRVFNKEDRLPDKDCLANLCRRFQAVAVSALRPETLPPLLVCLETLVGGLGHAPRTPGDPPEKDALT